MATIDHSMTGKPVVAVKADEVHVARTTEGNIMIRFALMGEPVTDFVVTTPRGARHIIDTIAHALASKPTS